MLLLLLHLFVQPLYAQILHTTGFTTLKECIEKGSQVTFLLDEGWRSQQFILSLENGTVTREGLIISSEGKIFKDTIPYRINEGWWLREYKAQKERTFFDGRLVVLTSHDQHQWYHCLLQVLPRLKILIESGIQYDKICIHNIEHVWQKQSLAIVMEELNIPPDRLLVLDGDSSIEAKTLIVPSVPYTRKKQERKILPGWMRQFLQSSFLKNNDGPRSKRIYISRSRAKVRKIVNEEALIQFLENKGFKTLHLEELSVHDQAGYFHNADMIIAPHGSGLSNLVFSRSNTLLIEIDHERRGHFLDLARDMKCKHIRYFVELADKKTANDDFSVDLALFEKFYDSLAIPDPA